MGPKGKIYAIDVAPNFIPFMKEKLKKEGLKNVEVVLGKTDQTTLKENSVNMVLVIDTYHHFDEPEKMLKDFSKILKKNGKLVVIDFKRGPKAKAWINEHVQMNMEDYIKQISENGFKFLREEPIPFAESFQLTFDKQ